MPFLISALLHLSLALVLVVTHPVKPGSKTPQSAQNMPALASDTVEVTFLPKPVTPSPDDVLKSLDLDGVLSRAKKPTPCKKFYGGIGIKMRYNPRAREATVTEVAQGYIADREGIQPGDLMFYSMEIQGQPGTSVSFTTCRRGVCVMHDVKREKICSDWRDP